MRMFLAGGVLALVSFLAGRFSAPQPREIPAPLAGPAATDPALMNALERLEAGLRALRDDLALRSTPTERRPESPAATPAALPSAPDLAAQVERLERIAARLSADRSAPEAPLATPRDPAAPRSAACLELFRDLDTLLAQQPAFEDKQGGAQFEKTYAAAVKHWEQAHSGWTLEQVAERYGAPDRLQADSEGPSYVYTTVGADGLEERFVFQSRHGLIYDVDLYVHQPLVSGR